MQPQRGLIVDDMGRPLVANRTSWVVSVDRTVLGKLDRATSRRVLLDRVAEVVDVAGDAASARSWSPAATTARCRASAGTARRTSRSRSPATSTQAVALRILEQPEDYPGVARRAAERARLPAARSASTPPTCSATSARSPRTSSTRPRTTATARSTAPRRSAAPASRRSTTRWLRGMPGYQQRRGRLDGPGARRRRRGRRPARRHPGHLASTPRCRASSSSSSRETITTARGDLRHGHRPQLRRRLRRRRRDGGRHRPDRRDGQPADVRPRGLGRRHLARSSSRRLYSAEGRHPAARPGHPGPVRAGLDLEAVHDRRRAHQRLRPRHPAGLLLGVPGRQPRRSRTTSPAPTATSASPRRSRSRATRSSTGSATTSGSGSAPTSPTSTPRTRWSRRPRRSASAARPASTCPARPPAGSPTASGSAPTTSRMKDYYCGIADKPQDSKTSDFVYTFAQRVLRRGLRLPRRRRRELRDRPGRHHRHAAPAGPRLRRDRQRRHALRAADRQGRRRARRHRGARGSRRRRSGSVDVPDSVLGYIDDALKGVTRQGTMAWRMGGFPLDQVHDPRQDRLGRGLRQAVDVLGRVVLRRLRRGDDGQPGRHRLRHLRPGGPHDLGVALRHRRRPRSCPATAAIPGTTPPTGLPDVPRRRLDPAAGAPEATDVTDDDRPPDARRSTGCCCSPCSRCSLLGTPAGLVGHQRTASDLTGGDPHGVPATSSWSTSRSGWC